MERLGTQIEGCENTFFDIRLDGSWAIHFGKGRARD